MRRRAIFATVLLATLGTVGPSSGLTFLDLATGDPSLPPDARAVAMGRTHVAEAVGGYTAATNPAALAWMGRLDVRLGGGGQRLRETRSIPAFDNFDNFLVESIYVLNNEAHAGGGIGAAGGIPWRALEGRLGAGISYAPVWDFNYFYVEEVRDNNAFTQPRDQLLALNDIQGNGTVDGLTLGVGGTPIWELSLGASVQFLRGKQNLLKRTRFQDGDKDVFGEYLEIFDLSAERAVLGVSVRPTHRWDVGLVWNTETTLKGAYSGAAFDPDTTITTDGTVEIQYPHQVTLGAAFRPRAQVWTTFRMDVEWAEWSKFQHTLYDDLELDDTFTFRFGVEHIFFTKLPARFGFHYRPSPESDQIATTTFTFGAGLDVGPLRADLGFEVGNRKYRFEDVFPDDDFGGTSRVYPDLVEENTFAGFATLSYALGFAE